MSLVAGVDLGGKRARIVLVNPRFPREPVIWAFEPKDVKTHVEAARRAATWARLRFAGMTPPTVAYFERPFGRFPEVNYQLSLMAGAILAGVPAETSVEFVEASWCRALVGISARAKKETIIEWAEAETGLVLDEHSADGYVCARAVLAFGAKERAS